MHTLNRQFVALGMLAEDLAELAGDKHYNKPPVLSQYLRLLKQFYTLVAQLSESVVPYSEMNFLQEVRRSGVALQFGSKRMITIYLRLTGFVLDFYAASQKLEAIRDNLFDEHADKRFELLQVKAIRARAQFKTVVQALGKKDYQLFFKHAALPVEDWGWDVLRLEN